jgi:hypothetical protein
VRKAGGKYKMLPLFDETTAKIRTVAIVLSLIIGGLLAETTYRCSKPTNPSVTAPGRPPRSS